MEKNNNYPYVIIHMLSSLNGKIDGAFFEADKTAIAAKVYAELRGEYDCQAVVYGTTTMLGGYADGRVKGLKETKELSKEDYVNPEGKALGNYIVAMDPEGILAYSSHMLEKKGRPAAHVIEVLTENVSLQYLSYLKENGISWVIAGKDAIDCKELLSKLHDLFGIKKLMVAGGAVTNWSFLSQGLVDELSLVISPVTDGETNTASVFASSSFLQESNPVEFHLKDVKTYDGDVIALRYTCE